MPYLSYRFDDAKLLESGNPVYYADHPQLKMYYIYPVRGGGTPIFFKLGPNEKCVKGMQVRKQGLGEAVHHIPHTWVNSCKDVGFSRVRVYSQPKN